MLLKPTTSTSQTAGLYIHIPFCRTKCGYCDFYSVTSTSVIPDFLRALFIEMTMVPDRFGAFDTVYVGGGTPSLLRPEQIEDLLAKVRQGFSLVPSPEITLETNPADLDLSYLRSLREAGVNRLNIGIQSFNQGILRFLGRRHSSREAISAMEASRRAGFNNIGIDLIYGIPGQDLKSWRETLTRTLSFSPEHLSCYQLTLEAKTPLGMRCREKEFSLPGEGLQYEFFMKTAEWLEDAGYLHYEVSNFAREEAFTSRHNQKYWNHSPYLGLGPSAHSFLGNRRWWNPRSLDQYLGKTRAGERPVEETEVLTAEQLRLEAWFLGLRTRRGIHLQQFAERYGCHLITQKRESLDRLLGEGLLSLRDGYLAPTRAGLAVADRLALI